MISLDIKIWYWRKNTWKYQANSVGALKFYSQPYSLGGNIPLLSKFRPLTKNISALKWFFPLLLIEILRALGCSKLEKWSVDNPRGKLSCTLALDNFALNPAVFCFMVGLEPLKMQGTQLADQTVFSANLTQSVLQKESCISFVNNCKYSWATEKEGVI